MDPRTSFSVLQQLIIELSAKWILSILSDLPLTRKTEKNVYFFNLEMIVCWTEQNDNYLHSKERQPRTIFCENSFHFVNLQLFLFQLEKNHATQLPGFSSHNTKWGPYTVVRPALWIWGEKPCSFHLMSFPSEYKG